MNDDKFCPLLKRECSGEACAWYNSSRVINECAIAVLPDDITDLANVTSHIADGINRQNELLQFIAEENAVH